MVVNSHQSQCLGFSHELRIFTMLRIEEYYLGINDKLSQTKSEALE
jgi:hypothetical protein